MDLELAYVPLETNLESSFKNTTQLNFKDMNKSVLSPLSTVSSYSLAKNRPIFCHKIPYRYNSGDFIDVLNAVRSVDSSQYSSFNLFSCDSITGLVSTLFGSHLITFTPSWGSRGRECSSWNC